MTTPTETLSFESALERLESIIESMENGHTPLADLVAKFEEGSTLLKVCQGKLKQAELKIEKLNLHSGELEPFADETPEA